MHGMLMINLEPGYIEFKSDICRDGGAKGIQIRHYCSQEEIRTFLIELDVVNAVQSWPPRDLILRLPMWLPKNIIERLDLRQMEISGSGN